MNERPCKRSGEACPCASRLPGYVRRACSLPTWTLYHNSPLFPMLSISYNLKHLYQYRGYCGQATNNYIWRPGQWCYGKQVHINRLNMTIPNSTTPAANAPRLYQLDEKPSLKMLCLLRQLNPWNRRARVRVANAMVLAVAALPVLRPVWKAIMVQTAMTPPWVRIVVMKSFVRILSSDFWAPPTVNPSQPAPCRWLWPAVNRSAG